MIHQLKGGKEKKMQLEQTLEIYQPMQTQRTMPERRQRSYTIVDLESLSASALYTGEIQNGADAWRGNIRNITPNTAYFPLTSDGSIGVTHHKKGLGKLKYNEDGIEYGVPISDIIEKYLKDWRIDKK